MMEAAISTPPATSEIQANGVRGSVKRAQTDFGSAIPRWERGTRLSDGVTHSRYLARLVDDAIPKFAPPGVPLRDRQGRALRSDSGMDRRWA